VDDPTQGRSEASSGADSTVVKARWLRVARVTVVLVIVVVIVAVIVGAEVIAIGVEKLPTDQVFVMNLFLLAGLGFVSEGLTLTPQGRDEKPQFGDEGYVWLWIAHRLPLRLARVWSLLTGLALLAAVGYGLWINRP
jgi:hypothetical protein